MTIRWSAGPVDAFTLSRPDDLGIRSRADEVVTVPSDYFFGEQCIVFDSNVSPRT